MLPLGRDELATVLRGLGGAEQPGPLVAAHVLNTGHGTCSVDRWPRPRASLAVSGANYALLGDPTALCADEVRSKLAGFVAAPDAYEPLLRQAFPSATVMARVILVQRSPSENTTTTDAARVKRLEPGDAAAVRSLDPDLAWIANTWGGADGLAVSGFAWGAFAGGRLASVACSFFVGQQYEDIGVVTQATFRGRGLSRQCAAALCAEIHARRRVPSWSTSPDNTASLRVAEKLGFVVHHHARLWVVGRGVPGVAQASAGEAG